MNRTNKYGYTPLSAAAASGFHRVCMELLHTPGVNVNIKNLRGDTPLFVACYEKQDHLVRTLLVRSPSCPVGAAVAV